eukprot:4064850-Lingulodinium_polyedra.AAC.1
MRGFGGRAPGEGPGFGRRPPRDRRPQCPQRARPREAVGRIQRKAQVRAAFARRGHLGSGREALRVEEGR